MTGKASGELNTFSRYYDFTFAKVNCIENGDLCLENEVQSYPSILYFKNGKFVSRNKGQKSLKQASDIVEDVLESIQPGSRPRDGIALPEVGADHVDKDAKPQKPEAKDKDKEAGKSAGAKQNSVAATADPAKATQSSSAGSPVQTKDVLASLSLRNFNPKGESVALNETTFQPTVTLSKEPWLVKFYAPWCHHCQALAPNWNEMAISMKGKLNVAEVDCEANQQLCRQAKIQAYPTIMFMYGGLFAEYNGLRGVGDLIKYANSCAEAAVGIENVDSVDFEKLEEKHEVIFTYFYDHATVEEDFTALDRMLLPLIGHAKLVKTNDTKLASRFKVTTFPRLLVSKEGQPTYYTALAPKDMRDVTKVLAWMKTVWLPLIPEITTSNSKDIMKGRMVVLAVLSRDRPDEFQRAKKELKDAAVEWVDLEKTKLQMERQELRDAKQLKIDAAEAKGDEAAEEKAKNIKVQPEKKNKRKEVGFAWVDGVFWERWLQDTYGVNVASDGERVIITDEDVSGLSTISSVQQVKLTTKQNHRYYDTTPADTPLKPTRASILDTLRDIMSSSPTVTPKTTASWFSGFFYRMTHLWVVHPYLSLIAGTFAVAGIVLQRRRRRGTWKGSMGGLNGVANEMEKGLGGWMSGNGNSNGKVD